MKKNLFITSLLLLSLNMYSQIAKDTFEEDGSRIIISKAKGLTGSFKVIISFRLMDYIEVNETNNYSVLLTVIGNNKDKEYTQGRKLLIKLEDESIIELSNQNNIRQEDYRGFAADLKYPIQEDDILKIINNKATKLRIENDFDYIDVKVKGNLLSKGMKKLYEAIQKEKVDKKKMTKADLYDGF